MRCAEWVWPRVAFLADGAPLVGELLDAALNGRRGRTIRRSVELAVPGPHLADHIGQDDRILILPGSVGHADPTASRLSAPIGRPLPVARSARRRGRGSAIAERGEVDQRVIVCHSDDIGRRVPDDERGMETFSQRSGAGGDPRSVMLSIVLWWVMAPNHHGTRPRRNS